MGTADRKAKVTPETREEARLLKYYWDTKAHPGQAEFGEQFDIGNQSAVGQFLRGDTPLSLKAAQGFARGLGINLEDFSPRLARKAAEIAGMAPAEGLSSDVLALAREIEQFEGRERARIVRLCRDVLKLARKGGQDDDHLQRQTV